MMVLRVVLTVVGHGARIDRVVRGHGLSVTHVGLSVGERIGLRVHLRRIGPHILGMERCLYCGLCVLCA